MEFDFQKHIFEIDSDTFGTIFSTSHILQIVSKKSNYFDTKPNKDDVLKLFGILISGILIHLFSFPSYRTDFYDKKWSHPHVLVRLKNVIKCSTNYFTNALKYYNYDFKIDLETAKSSVLSATEKLSSKIYRGFLFKDFLEKNLINESEIEIYLNEILSNLKSTSNAAMNIHNSVINNRTKN